jgi:hypothetical protein
LISKEHSYAKTMKRSFSSSSEEKDEERADTQEMNLNWHTFEDFSESNDDQLSGVILKLSLFKI